MEVVGMIIIELGLIFLVLFLVAKYIRAKRIEEIEKLFEWLGGRLRSSQKDLFNLSYPLKSSNWGLMT